MIKSLLLLIILSIAAAFLLPQYSEFLALIGKLYHFLVERTEVVFASGQLAHLIEHTLIFVGLSLLLSLIPAVICWLLKRQFLLYWMVITWISWLILVTTVATP